MAIIFIVMSVALIYAAFMSYSRGKRSALPGHSSAYAEDQGVKTAGVAIVLVILAAFLFAIGIMRMGGV